MITRLRKLANIELKRKIGLLKVQFDDENYSIEELEQLLESDFKNFIEDFNTLAVENNINIKLIISPLDDDKFSIIENEEELYKTSQKEFTHALREEEFIPTRGKKQGEIKLFISYSHKDKNDVELLIEKLEKTPYPFVFWKDDNQLISGEKFKGNIKEAIDDCDFGLLMVSENFESKFIVEEELPYFLEMNSSEISKTKVAIPLFINSKENAVQRLNYINNETHIFSYEDRGFIESHDRDKFIEALAEEIFTAIGKQKNTENKIIEDLQNLDEAKDVNDNFIPTKAELGIDIVKEIKEWSKIIVKDIIMNIDELKESIESVNKKIKNETVRLERSLDRINLSKRKIENYANEINDKKKKLNNTKTKAKDKKKLESDLLKLEDKLKLENINIAKNNQNNTIFYQNIKLLEEEKESLDSKLRKIDIKRNHSRYFALLGDSGMGKTWSCMKIALELQEESNTVKPIYLDLRHFATSEAIKNEFDWKEIIEIVVRKSLSSFKKDMSVDTIFDIIKRGEAFVIFDGLDEVTVHLDDDRRSNAFIRELKNVVLLNENNKILFSCRTHYFRTIQEQFSMLSGQDREKTQYKDFMSLELLPFTWNQIEEYCKKNGIDFSIFKNVVTKIHNLEEISQRPYSLKLITLQIRELEEKIKRGEEVNSADIYLGIIESSLNRDSGKHTLSKVHKPLIMQELSAFMWKKGTRSLEYPKLDEWFSKWLYDNPVIADEYKNESREKLKSDLRGATFMVRPNTNIFRFSHTSLQEFFLAQYLFKGFEDGVLDRFNMLIPSTETLEFFIMLWKRHTEKEKLNEYFNQLILKNSLFAFELYLISNKLEHKLEINHNFELENIDLSKRVIKGDVKTPLILCNSSFNNVNFDESRLIHVDFSNTIFSHSRFMNVTLENVNFTNSCFQKCLIKFTGRIDGTVFKDVEYKESTLFTQGLQ